MPRRGLSVRRPPAGIISVRKFLLEILYKYN
uniref:Uncharacterized protein n=1 Tax=Myoviridae sp. ctJ2i1 TaxID=2825079 RepID=A0A8S5V1J8_9CAUD|nr:MAG TPA: hypothetical protein [Myoviridae sp. ctJ2i1]